MKAKFKNIKITTAQKAMVKLIEDFGLTVNDEVKNDIEFIKDINICCDTVRSLADECARSVERQLYNYYGYEILISAK